MKQSVQGLFRILEDWWQTIQQNGIPAAMLRDQVPSAALPPATNTSKGGVTLSDATPAAIGTAAPGTSSAVSRTDHVHAHGSQAGGSQHSAATTSTAGFATLAASGGTTAGTVVQATDTRLSDARTPTSHNHTSGAGDGGVLTNDEHDGYAEYAEISAPSTPAGNKIRLYAKDKSGTSALYYKDDGGTEYDLSATGGGGGSLTVEEVDGSPTDSAVTKIVFPNGTLSITSHVVTYTPTGGGSTENHILIVDSKSAGTNGGTFSSGSWVTRDLNTERYDTGNNASVASNQITLDAGTYRCRIDCPAYGTLGRHQARLRNITDSTTTLVGNSGFVNTGVQVFAFIVGRFTIAGTKVFEVQHQCESTQTSFGLGVGVNSGFTTTEEIFTMVELWKE